MTRILYILMNHKSKSIKSKEFNFETIEINDIQSNNLNEVHGDWKYFSFYVLEAIKEKQGESDLLKTKIGLFTTDSLIDDKDFQTLLDIVFENWKFHFISENKLRDALFRGVAISLEDIKKVSEKKDLSIIPLGSLTQKNCNLISQGIHILRNSKNRRFKIALHRFAAAYKRSDPLDSVLDCCSCLEALYNLSDELRLKLSLISFHIVSKNKKTTLDAIYEMYGKRNDFIHGNKIPNVNREQVENYIGQTAKIIKSIIEKGATPNIESLTNQIFKYHK